MAACWVSMSPTLEMGLKGTTSKDEAKGGARMRDCIGIVEYFECNSSGSGEIERGGGLSHRV